MENTKKLIRQTEVLTQNMELSSCPVLFATKYKELIPILVKGIKEKDNAMFCFSNFKGSIFNAMDYIIANYHTTNSGRITTGMLYSAIEEFAKMYDMRSLFKYLPTNNKNILVEDLNDPDILKMKNPKNIFGIGILDEDYEDSDPDPYQTAGGYRNWIATKGTKVYYRLNINLSVTASFDSNCLIDHYNNNFAGLSTGNGTTTYKIGERVEKRSATLGREFIDKEWSKTKFKATVTKIDFAKLNDLIITAVPEFKDLN